MADELLPVLVERYKDDENVTVIVDRREADRRARRRSSGEPLDPAFASRRVIRDRRRARVVGDALPLARV
jgi:hypothetical protein